MDSSFIQAPLQVPKLSGFDKSHQNLLSLTCGTLTPVLCDVLIPGSKVSLNFAASCQLPPLVSDTFMRVSLKTEAFFVPFRLLAGSFESWFCDDPKQFVDASAVNTFVSKVGFLPCFGGFDATTSGTYAASFGSSSLADYLGLRSDVIGDLAASTGVYYSAMPFLCYHRLFHDWYRNSLVQREVFLPPTVTSGGVSPQPTGRVAGCAPYLFFDQSTIGYVFSSETQLSLADGVDLFSLRQRNFGLDYFTTATPSPQQGAAQTVSFSTSGATGQFSIAALRAANSMQQFKERNNIAGNLYVEQLYARYGVRPSDGIAQRSLFLGSDSFEVYSKGIYQTADGTSGSNPLGSVAAQYGHGQASGKSYLVRDFEAKEPGFLMVICSLVPRVSYSTGIDRKFTNFVGAGSLTTLANPILQNVGPQPIYQYELRGGYNANVFGYTDRYAEYKTMQDELHGELRDGQSLDSFALQRSFAGSSSPSINNAFLQIPANFLDQVFATGGVTSGFSAWLDCYFDYKVAQPLAKYSLPSLQDPAYEHGKTIMVNRGGFKL